MKLHAAILKGPSGPFAVLRARPEAGESALSDQQRRSAVQCFKSQHNNIPVAFLAQEPSGMRLIGFEDATADLEKCVKDMQAPEVQWKDFDA
jgi:hypothetical protein